MAPQQLGAHAVDEEQDVRRGLGQHQPVGVEVRGPVERVTQRRRDCGHQIGERAPVVGRRDEVRRAWPLGHAVRVREERDSAKASNRSTPSAPSAAAETRSEKSSAESEPV